jgi:hypothetical protein
VFEGNIFWMIKDVYLFIYLFMWMIIMTHEVMNAISAAMIDCCSSILIWMSNEWMMIMSHEAYIYHHS